MKKKNNDFGKKLGIYLLAFSIPCFFVIGMVQSQQYMNIEKEVADLEQVQKDLIESNKALVTDISVLSSSERIEKIAVEELGMRKATSDEIVRVSIKGK
jgi:cell division protein FtsL